jgi:toxin-antitoxin system PIN domain toxin
VYANDLDSPHHSEARTWFEGVLNGSAKVGLPWPTLLAFVRLTGNPRIARRPIPLSETWSRAREWLALPNTWIPLPTERHLDVFSRLLEGESRVDLANDAHLAALAIEHGLTVCSTDGDFARFSGLRWVNPLRGG